MSGANIQHSSSEVTLIASLMKSHLLSSVEGCSAVRGKIWKCKDPPWCHNFPQERFTRQGSTLSPRCYQQVSYDMCRTPSTLGVYRARRLYLLNDGVWSWTQTFKQHNSGEDKNKFGLLNIYLRKLFSKEWFNILRWTSFLREFRM